MKQLVLICCFLLVGFAANGQVFEGKLIYHHDMRMKNNSYSDSRNYYDTLAITYKNKNYVKLTNKKSYEKIIFIDSLRKRYVIYKDNLSKSKHLSMDEDNLNFGKLYNRENSNFGRVISVSKRDTIIEFESQSRKFNKLFVEREYGNETYVYSNSEEYKLADNRNLLRNIGEQIHPTEIATELNNALLFYYKLDVNKTDLSEEYQLVRIQKVEIENNVFDIPEHRDAKGYKKENKKNGRFKFYELITD